MKKLLPIEVDDLERVVGGLWEDYDQDIFQDPTKDNPWSGLDTRSAMEGPVWSDSGGGEEF